MNLTSVNLTFLIFSKLKGSAAPPKGADQKQHHPKGDGGKVVLFFPSPFGWCCCFSFCLWWSCALRASGLGDASDVLMFDGITDIRPWQRPRVLSSSHNIVALLTYICAGSSQVGSGVETRGFSSAMSHLALAFGTSLRASLVVNVRVTRDAVSFRQGFPVGTGHCLPFPLRDTGWGIAREWRIGSRCLSTVPKVSWSSFTCGSSSSVWSGSQSLDGVSQALNSLSTHRMCNDKVEMLLMRRNERNSQERCRQWPRVVEHTSRRLCASPLPRG